MTEEDPSSQRRQAILNAALGVFDAKGHASATVDDISAKAMFDRGAEVSEHSLVSLKQGLLTALKAWSTAS